MIRVYSQDEELLAVFANDGSSKCPYFDDELYEELNGISELIFSVPMDHPDAQHVVEENLVVIEDPDEPGAYRLFSIKKLEEVRDEDGKLYKRAECEEQAIGELNDEIVTDRRPQNTTALDALTAALESEGGSRWQVGTVDATENASTNFYYESRMSALQKILETWQMEVRFRVEIAGTKITGRYVDLFRQRGEDNGIRVEIGRNLKSIKRTVETDHIKTALYGRGKGEQVEETGGYGRRLTFADVEWSTTAKEPPDPTDKPMGQEWVGDPEALERWGYPNPDGTKRHRFGVYVNDQQEDPAALLRETWEELQRLKEPRVTYETTMADLGRLAGYPHYRAKLGDVVRVIDRGFNPPLTVEARVIKRRRPLSDDRETELTLGNFRPEISDLIREIRREVDKKVEVGAPISWLETKMQTKAREMDNLPGFMAYTPGQGLLVANAPDLKDATSAIEIRGGGFRISNKPIKKPDGTVDFEWRTFGDGDGFTADEITSGTLNASLVNVISESADHTRSVKIADGNVYSYDNNDLSMGFGSYRLELFDTLNKEKLGQFGVSYLIEDVEKRGMSWVGEQSFISIDQDVDGVLRSFFEASIENNFLYLSGGWSGSQSGTASVTILSDEWVWGTGGGGYRMTDQAAIRMFRQSDGSFVYIYYGDSYSSNASSFFEIRENATATTYRTMMRCADSSITLYPRVYLGSSRVGWVEGTSNSVRLGAGPGTDHYIYVLDTGDIHFRQNGVITNSFWADGTKNTGIIEIDGKRWGMSPIDSPQYLIEYVVFDQDVTEDGITVELDAKYVQAVENYAVFPSRGDVSITDKTPTSFTVKGPTGKVDLRIVGIRIGKLDAFWEDIEARVSEGTLMKTFSIQQEQQEKIDPEAIKKQAKPIKRPGYGRKEGDQ